MGIWAGIGGYDVLVILCNNVLNITLLLLIILSISEEERVVMFKTLAILLFTIHKYTLSDFLFSM